MHCAERGLLAFCNHRSLRGKIHKEVSVQCQTQDPNWEYGKSVRLKDSRVTGAWTRGVGSSYTTWLNIFHHVAGGASERVQVKKPWTNHHLLMCNLHHYMSYSFGSVYICHYTVWISRMLQSQQPSSAGLCALYLPDDSTSQLRSNLLRIVGFILTPFWQILCIVIYSDPEITQLQTEEGGGLQTHTHTHTERERENSLV